MQVIELGEDARLPLIKEGIDGLLDDADWVIWPSVQIGSNLGENVLSDIVEGVLCQHICARQGRRQSLRSAPQRSIDTRRYTVHIVWILGALGHALCKLFMTLRGNFTLLAFSGHSL